MKSKLKKERNGSLSLSIQRQLDRLRHCHGTIILLSKDGLSTVQCRQDILNEQFERGQVGEPSAINHE